LLQAFRQEKQAAIRWTARLTKTRLFSNSNAQQVNLTIYFPGYILDCMLQFMLFAGVQYCSTFFVGVDPHHLTLKSA
jgi:hypothetical protein